MTQGSKHGPLLYPLYKADLLYILHTSLATLVDDNFYLSEWTKLTIDIQRWEKPSDPALIKINLIQFVFSLFTILAFLRRIGTLSIISINIYVFCRSFILILSHLHFLSYLLLLFTDSLNFYLSNFRNLHIL